MLQVRENDISLRKWSGGTAPLRTLGAQRHLRRKWSGGTAPLRTLDIDQQSVFFVVLHISSISSSSRYCMHLKYEQQNMQS